MKARVTVTLKSGVLDPQGKAIEGALKGARRRRARRRAPGQDVRHRDRRRRPRGRARRGSARPASGCSPTRSSRTTRSRSSESACARPSSCFPASIAKATSRARCGRRPARAPTIVWHAERDLPAGHGSRRAAGRLLLRRLSALRRDRRARADHEGGRRPRRARRAGARHLQRLPDPVRGRACCRAC